MSADVAARPHPILDRLTLRLHALADRLDWLPEGFGDDAPFSPTDAVSVRHAWRRAVRRGIDDNPERVFALKIAGGLLAVVFVVLTAAIAAF